MSNIISEEKKIESILTSCQNQIKYILDSLGISKYSLIELYVSQVVEDRHLDIQMSSFIKNLLLAQIVSEKIKNIQTDCEVKMNLIFERYKYTQDLKQWYDSNYKGNQEQKIQAFMELLKQPILQKNRGNLLVSINSFMFYFSLILQKYVEDLFLELDIRDRYSKEFKHLLKVLNAQIIDKFQQDYPSQYQDYKKCIGDLKQYIELTIEKQIKSLFGVNKNIITSPIGEYEQLRRSISEQYQKGIITFLAQNDCEEAYRYLYQSEIKDTYKKIDKLFSKDFQENKAEGILDQNSFYKQYMEHIPLEDLVNTFRATEHKLKHEYIAAFLIRNISIETDEDRQILVSMLKQFENPIQELRKLIDILSNLPLHNLQQNITILDSFVNRYNSKFIKEMKSPSIDLLEFYKHLTQIYMLTTNIEVNVYKSQISFKPFFGRYYKHRVSILRDLQSQMELSDATFFFNFLDSYFETNYIYPQLFTGMQSSKKINIQVNQSQEDYPILKKLRSEDKKDESYLTEVDQLFQQQIIKIKLENNFKEVPEIFHLQKISEKGIRSRNVIIAFSGFTSQAEDKQQKWQQLAKIYPNSEIYAIQYRSQTVMETCWFSIRSLTQVIAQGYFKGLLGVGLGLLQIIINNPFLKGWKQADLAGLYLAHLIHRNDIFLNSSISLIGFSLGTQVINSCLFHYKNLIDKDGSQSQIASVCMFGGVADIDFFQKNNLISCISYKLFNCYCKNDKILTILLRMVKLFTQPAGLNPIQGVLDKIENIDFSEQISGHIDFFDNHHFVIQKIDFRQEYLRSLQENHLKSFISFTQSEIHRY